MKYRKGYKYQLAAKCITQTSIKPASTIETEYLKLMPSGILIIENGYAWDGPSGPTIDTKSFMRGSLVHDVFYQLMRQGFLAATWREAADDELVRICKEDGMWWPRRWWVYQGVRWFAASAASQDNVKEILEAP